jgi:hypothetical protein
MRVGKKAWVTQLRVSRKRFKTLNVGVWEEKTYTLPVRNKITIGVIMALLKKNDVFQNADGDMVVVSSVNADGTVTTNYASGSGKTGYAGKYPNRNLLPQVNLGESDFEGLNEDSSTSVSLDDYQESNKVPTVSFEFTPKEKDFVVHTVEELRRDSQERLAKSYSGIEQFMLQSNITYTEDVLAKLANSKGTVDFDSIESQVVKASVERYADRLERSVEDVPDFPIKDDMKGLLDEAKDLLARIEKKEQDNTPSYDWDTPSTSI